MDAMPKVGETWRCSDVEEGVVTDVSFDGYVLIEGSVTRRFAGVQGRVWTKIKDAVPAEPPKYSIVLGKNRTYGEELLWLENGSGYWHRTAGGGLGVRWSDVLEEIYPDFTILRSGKGES